MDNFFEFEDIDDSKKVKYAKTKLKGPALTWWNFVQEDRVKKGKPKLCSWDRMVEKVKAQFLPTNYAIQTFMKLQELKQREMDVMSYTEEFHRLCIRVGHNEDEVERVAIYLSGLRLNIRDEISLNPPKTVEECF